MFVSRSNQVKIFDSFRSSNITCVLGARRVGKSTLVKHFADENPDKKWVFLNMDKRAERLQIEADKLLALIEEQSLQKIDPKQPIWVAIDEAQKCPALFEQIKVLYDQYKGSKAIKFILTGSGFLSLHKMVSESLAGRIAIFYLREFSLRETASLLINKMAPLTSILDVVIDDFDLKKIETIVNELLPFKQVLQNALHEQLVWGGLPEVLENPDKESRLAYLANYLQTYLEKDIRDISTISDINLYQKMMEVTAQQTGSVRDDQRIVEALGCSRDTLKKYRGFLEATLVYCEIYPFIGSSLKRIVKSPKGYLTNNGLISYLGGVDQLKILESTGSVGHRFENWCLKELQIALDRHVQKSGIYFWRTSGGVEVDFVVEKKPNVLPFEITYTKQAIRKKINHLKNFMSHEKETRVGLCIYNGELSYDKKDNILFLPAWVLG